MNFEGGALVRASSTEVRHKEKYEKFRWAGTSQASWKEDTAFPRIVRPVGLFFDTPRGTVY